MKIRKATKKDARKMVFLKSRTFEKINSKDYPKEVVKEYVKLQTSKRIIEDMKKDKYFIIENNGKILGMVRFYNKNIIGNLFIKWDEIGKGYGKKLMDFVENYAKKKGEKKIILYPTKTAKKFYLKLGYKPFGKKDLWKIAGHKFRTKKMEKKL